MEFFDMLDQYLPGMMDQMAAVPAAGDMGGAMPSVPPAGGPPAGPMPSPAPGGPMAPMGGQAAAGGTGAFPGGPGTPSGPARRQSPFGMSPEMIKSLMMAMGGQQPQQQRMAPVGPGQRAAQPVRPPIGVGAMPAMMPAARRGY